MTDTTPASEGCANYTKGDCLTHGCTTPCDYCKAKGGPTCPTCGEDPGIVGEPCLSGGRDPWHDAAEAQLAADPTNEERREAMIQAMIDKGHTRERAEAVFGLIHKTLFGPGGRFEATR
jgi:hypothetical protein